MNEEMHIAVDDGGDKVDSEDVIKEEESKLEKAYQLKNEANMKYNAKDYAGAIYLYHRCLLFARSVQQLSQWNLEGLAREERARQKLRDPNAIEFVDTSKDTEKMETSPLVLENQSGKSGDVSQRRRLNSTMRGEDIKREAAELVLKCYNNLAACILNGPSRKEEDYLRAVEYCDKVLMQDKNNEKALFRKGSALAKANQHEQAINILRKCNHHDARVLIDECQQVLTEERRRRDDEIRRNFARHRENDGNHDVMQNVATMNGTPRIGASDEQPSV